MLQVILFTPKIPPNTGNIIRLCANTGAHLRLIRPLGFKLDNKHLRRAGLDYHEYAQVSVHEHLDACLDAIGQARVFAYSTRGCTTHIKVDYRNDDALLFGCETAGLPDVVLNAFPPERRLYLPMRAESRSLNLSNAVAIALYEAWRQLGFPGSDMGNRQAKRLRSLSHQHHPGNI